MQVCARDPPGVSELPNHLPFFHHIAPVDQNLRHVIVARVHAKPVVDDHRIAAHNQFKMGVLVYGGGYVIVPVVTGRANSPCHNCLGEIVLRIGAMLCSSLL